MNETHQNTLPDSKPLTFLAWVITLGSLAFAFLDFGLPIYGREIGANALEIGGLYTTQAIMVVILRPLVGMGLDRIGRKPFLFAALVCYTIAMALFASADRLIILYLAQIVMGITTATMWIAAFATGADLAPTASRGRIMGQVQEATSRGAIMGVVVGFIAVSALYNQTGWRAAFIFYAAVALGAMLLAWRKVPETRPASHPEAARRRVSRHLPRLMVVVFITSTSVGMLRPLYLIFLQDHFTTNFMALALAYAPAGLAASFLPSRLGRLSDRFGRAPLMAIGLIISATLSVCLPLAPELAWLILLFTVEQVGWSMAAPAEAAMVADLVGRDVRGAGYGIYTAGSWAGMAIGPLIGGWLYDHVGRSAPFFLNAGMMTLAAGLVLVLLREKIVRPERAESG